MKPSIPNYDPATGIYYGVLPSNRIGCPWFDESELDMDPEDDCEPHGYYVDTDELIAYQYEDDPDIFVIRSMYYTSCRECSPCAPNAGYLLQPDPLGRKAYCFDPSWFDCVCDEPTGIWQGEKTSCPYPVFRVDNDECVFTPKGN